LAATCTALHLLHCVPYPAPGPFDPQEFIQIVTGSYSISRALEPFLGLPNVYLTCVHLSSALCTQTFHPRIPAEDPVHTQAKTIQRQHLGNTIAITYAPIHQIITEPSLEITSGIKKSSTPTSVLLSRVLLPVDAGFRHHHQIWRSPTGRLGFFFVHGHHIKIQNDTGLPESQSPAATRFRRYHTAPALDCNLSTPFSFTTLPSEVSPPTL
jgi:hypothetical protein